jgi:hypothetical protein
VDATVRFFEEFMIKEEPPPTQKPTQQAATGMPREDEANKEHIAMDSFEPTYMYDAMKEKRQLKNLLVRSFSRCFLLFLIRACLMWYRMANSRTRKSFFASTSMHLTKSCSRYPLLLVALSRLLLHPE